MSQFPAIKPSSRSFVAGTLPVNTFASISGKETRVIMGDTLHGHVVELSFANILEPKVKQILDHWYGRQGTALAFTLPTNIWSGWSDYIAGVTAQQQWRYAAAPNIEAVSAGIMNVSVELVALA